LQPQPAETLKFYLDLAEVDRFELETTGVLKGGKQFWASAYMADCKKSRFYITTLRLAGSYRSTGSNHRF